MGATRIIPSALRGLTPDGWLLFVTRSVRLFAYGSLSVILVFYLVSLGLSESQTGLLLSLTLAGDVVVSLFLTTHADRIGRRRMLVVGACRWRITKTTQQSAFGISLDSGSARDND